MQLPAWVVPWLQAAEKTARLKMVLVKVTVARRGGRQSEEGGREEGGERVRERERGGSQGAEEGRRGGTGQEGRDDRDGK